MFCSVCRQHASEDAKTNSFIVGTKNLKLEAIKDHESSKCHIQVKKRINCLSIVDLVVLIFTCSYTLSVKNKKVAGKNIEWLVDFEIHQPQWPVDKKVNFHPCTLYFDGLF